MPIIHHHRCQTKGQGRLFDPFLVIITLLICPFSESVAEVSEIIVPSVGVTQVNDEVEFGQSSFNELQIVGAPTGAITLSAQFGTINLAQTQGLSFVEGDGINDSSMNFRGTESQIRAALNGLTFIPNQGFAGRARIVVSVDGLSESWPIAVNQPIDVAVARQTIMADVRSMHGGGQPGKMLSYGLHAHDIALYASNPKDGPAVVAAGWGAGRVVAMPDHQMLNMLQFGVESETLYHNTLTWLGGDRAAMRIVTLSSDTAQWLTDNGYTNVLVATLSELEQLLEDADVFVAGWLGANVSIDHQETIKAFVSQGGGLLICDYGVGYDWWWGKPIHEAPGNQLLREAGIGFIGGNRWDVGVVDLAMANTEMSGDLLIRILAEPSVVDAPQLDEAGGMLISIQDALSPSDPLRRGLDAALESAIVEVSPTPETPVSSDWEKGLLRRELQRMRETPPAEITPHRTAELLFGPVPSDAARVSRNFEINPAITHWHSTGLYAPPGEEITLTVPTDILPLGFKVRIGGHTDDISSRDSWLRPPQVHWQAELNQEQTSIASPFGGALYVDVGTHAVEMAPFEVNISGAIEAPYFVLGQTSLEAWRESVRMAPAPYAELVSPNLIISLPSTLVRELEDPESLMAFWDMVVRLQDDLAGHAGLRRMAERINIDVQISVGYLHAGYPTQGPLQAAPELVDLSVLNRSGSWGWFHELGHEAQRRPDKSWGWNNAYTFDGSVEATVNLFTVYAMDQLELVPDGGWRWTSSAQSVMAKALEGLMTGGYLNVGVAVKLAFFLELRDHFGWSALKRALERYNESGIDLPTTDAAKRDQWLLWMSRAAGVNLSRFMNQVWSMNLSAAAMAQVADLPSWMPAVGGVAGPVYVAQNDEMVFDLAGLALSHDGVADIVDVELPTEGELSSGPDGFVYRPPVDFIGSDTFSYGVRSSSGHIHRSDVELVVTNQGVHQDTWQNVSGSSIAELRALSNFPQTPDRRTLIRTVDIGQNLDDSYGVRVWGYLVPHESDAYTFWIASDDNGELWLSSDESESRLELIARVSSWTRPYAWTATPEQRSVTIWLEAGHAYRIEALMKEAGGADHLSVAWSRGSEEPDLIPVENLYLSPPPPPAQMDMGIEDAGVGDIGLGDMFIGDMQASDQSLVDLDASVNDHGFMDGFFPRDGETSLADSTVQDGSVDLSDLGNARPSSDQGLQADAGLSLDGAVRDEMTSNSNVGCTCDVRPTKGHGHLWSMGYLCLFFLAMRRRREL